MMPLSLYNEVGGFDASSFFLYCDDVDLSWRVRRSGYRIIFQPAAVCFHDKRLSPGGDWQPSDAEKYYSAEAALLIAHKWSRPDLVAKHIKMFVNSGVDHLCRAAAEFARRRDEGKLPEPLDAQHDVGNFIEANYGPQRFTM